MSYQQEDRHPNWKSRSQQKDLPQKEDSLRKRLPNRKTDTQTANQKHTRNSCPRKETHYENAFPTGRLTPKWQITSQRGRLAPERRLIKKMPSQQEDWHPKRKSRTQQKDLPQKPPQQEGWHPNSKSRTKQEDLPQKKNTHWENVLPTGRPTPKQEITKPTERPAPERRLIKKTSAQQEDRHPNSKSKTQQE